MISTRDVIFDENTFFDGKIESDGQLRTEVDDLIAQIQLDPPQIKNEEILLETDDEFLSLGGSRDSDESYVDGDIEMFAEKEDDEDWEERFESFQRVRVGSAFHGTFETCRRQRKIHKRHLPPPPKTVKELENHPFRKEFEAAQSDHLRSHDKMKSWLEVDKTQAKGHQVLGCMWIFVYKTDKHGFLQKVKARLVVWGHQQAHNGLPTRATTLASTTFRTLMAITAKFDLETQ